MPDSAANASIPTHPGGKFTAPVLFCKWLLILRTTLDSSMVVARSLSKAGDQTDGATIPDWAQPYVGKPFEEGFIRAAAITIVGCRRTERSTKV